MNCAAFREALRGGLTTPESLEHLRSCPSCLEVAVAADPDNLFRSLGGMELVPPGGVDAFVAEVVQQVHLRETEHALGRRDRFSPMVRWSIAAALAILVGAITFTTREQTISPVAQQQPRPAVLAAAPAVSASLPIVESYEEAGAMIVELAAETDEVKVVMIFDETLPVDL